jgi:predicted Rossmann-fold nucleotide-binding protein
MCSKELYNFGVQLGQKIARKNISIVCGGLGGFMKAVCKGVKFSLTRILF